MNTYIFNQDGRCICAANSELPSDDVPAGATAVHSEISYRPDDIYFDNGICPIKEFAVTVASNRVANIPAGTRAMVGAASEIVNDGILELDVNYPTIVRVVLDHPHYRMKAVEVPCEA